MANKKTKNAVAKKPAGAKAATKKPATKKAKALGPEAPDVTEIAGSQEAYERFLVEAKALDERDVRPFRLDPSLAYHNVELGVVAVTPLEKRVRAELPAVDLEQLRSMPDLALAVCFAASQVDRGGGSSRQLAEPLRRAYALRETLLASAVALAKAGVLPDREVEKIQQGRGPLDAAQDCVDLAALFKKYATAVRGKSPVSAAHVTDASKLGTDLLKVLRPATAKRDRRPTGALKEAIETRDRLATLLAQRHERLRRAGWWLWGDAIDAHVPALQARAAKRTKKPEAELPKEG